MAVSPVQSGRRLRALTVRITPRAADLASSLAGRFVVLVRGASSTDAAMAGLDAARQELLQTAPRSDRQALSPVVLSPDGPLVRVGDLGLDDDGLRAVPGIAADAVAAAGVADGIVEVLAATGPLDELDDTDGAAVLRLFPTPGSPDGDLPARWLDLAVDWVLGDAAAHESVDIRLLGAPFSVHAADAAATLHAANASRAWCDVVRGNLRSRLRSASVTFGRAPHLALAAGGPDCDVEALLARLDLLCELARDVHDGLGYACVDLEPTFADIGSGLSGSGWRAHGGASPNAVAAQVGDVAVPDAYPYQVLGPGHLARRERRAGTGRRLGPLGRPLDGGRVEVAIGDPLDWIPPYETREGARERGWKVLSGLLLTDAELADLLAERARATQRPSDLEGPPDAVEAPDPWANERHSNGLRAGPDLDDVVLQALPHPRRGLRITLLELASWLGHEPHSDTPAGVSPVLAAYGRWLAAGLDDARRQVLKPYAARLVGTHEPGLSNATWRPLAPIDDARAWVAADWLARVQAPAWLRAAGLVKLADRIAKVRPRADRGHLTRLLTLLATAIDQLRAADAAAAPDAPLGATAARRAVDRSWDAWDRTSEACGWVAASEAAWVGVPEPVVSGAELRVLELARAPREDPALTAASPLIEASRAAALSAAAEAAWEDAARRTARAVDDVTRQEVYDVSLATAFQRARRAAGPRLGLDRDSADQALEQADAAARAELVRLIQNPPKRAGTGLDDARQAAVDSPGGLVWSEVQETARGVLGEEAWSAGMTAGRIAIDRVLQTAAPLTERALLVAVAREVAGLAGRSIVAHEGAEGLEPVSLELQGAAIGLLDQLLDVPDPAARRTRRSAARPTTATR
jgi:hypothetical protein